VTIELEAPGLEKDEIDVSVDDRQVTITGQKRVESERREGSMVVRERAFGRFQRAIPMPVAVTADGAEASYRRGVLKIRVPKAGSPGGRSIKIQKG
jgi:HSP20 family protein